MTNANESHFNVPRSNGGSQSEVTPLCGFERWVMERREWLRVPIELSRSQPDSEEFGRPAFETKKGTVSKEPAVLNVREQKQVRQCLGSTQGPYPPFSRYIPLSLVVECGGELWGKTSALSVSTRGGACWNWFLKNCVCSCGEETTTTTCQLPDARSRLSLPDMEERDPENASFLTVQVSITSSVHKL